MTEDLSINIRTAALFRVPGLSRKKSLEKTRLKNRGKSSVKCSKIVAFFCRGILHAQLFHLFKPLGLCLLMVLRLLGLVYFCL